MKAVETPTCCLSVCQICRVQWYIILKTAVNYFILSYAKFKVYVCVCVCVCDKM